MATFEPAFDYMIPNEKGFSNHPADRGGATKDGITLATYSRWLRRPVSVAELRNIPESVERAIYETNYFLPMGLEHITEQAIATALFDIGVVRGIYGSATLAQAACNQLGAAIAVDGHIGPHSLAALNALKPGNFLLAFESQVAEGFRRIVTANLSQAVFLKGWLARAERLLSLA